MILIWKSGKTGMPPSQKLVGMGAILRAPVDVKRTTTNDDIHVAVLESSEMQRSGEAGSF